MTVLLAALPLALTAGCYERTVSAKGLGTTKGDVQAPYRSETALDHAFDSVTGNAPPSKSKSKGSSPAQMPEAKPASIPNGERHNQ